MTVRAIVIRKSDVDRCPKRSMSASHYGRDIAGVVHCACELPEGWVWEGIPPEIKPAGRRRTGR